MEQEERTIRNGERKFLTVERVLLCMILLLQTTILFWLWQDKGGVVSGPCVGGDGEAQASRKVQERGQTMAPARRFLFPFPAFRYHKAVNVFDDMDRMFESALAEFGRTDPLVDLDNGWDRIMASPTMDMKERDNRYVVVFSLPGSSPADVRVTLEGRLLTVNTDVRSEDGSGRYIATFQRSVQLPGPVGDAHSAEAMLTNGVLRVSIPKNTGMEIHGKIKRLL